MDREIEVERARTAHKNNIQFKGHFFATAFYDADNSRVLSKTGIIFLGIAIGILFCKALKLAVPAVLIVSVMIIDMLVFVFLLKKMFFRKQNLTIWLGAAEDLTIDAGTGNVLIVNKSNSDLCANIGFKNYKASITKQGRTTEFLFRGTIDKVYGKNLIDFINNNIMDEEYSEHIWLLKKASLAASYDNEKDAVQIQMLTDILERQHQ